MSASSAQMTTQGCDNCVGIENLSPEMVQFRFAWELLWNMRDAVRSVCEFDYGEIELQSGSAFSSTRVRGNEAQVADPRDLVHTKFTPTTRLLDMKKAPGWNKCVLKHGYPQKGLLPGHTKAQSHQKLLILRCYDDLLDGLVVESESTAEGATQDMAHAVLLGNPGIGKSVGLTYILYRKLVSGEPVVYRREGLDPVLFTEDGVTLGDSEVERALNKLELMGTETWVLADRIEPRPTDIYRPNIRAIQASSPDVHRYLKWSKKAKASFYTMDLWAWEELYLLKYLHKFPLESASKTTDLSEESFIARLWECYLLFGGEPRLVYSLGVYTTGLIFARKISSHLIDVREAVRSAMQNQRHGAANFFFSVQDHTHAFMASRPYSTVVDTSLFVRRDIGYGKHQTHEARSAFIEAILKEEALVLSHMETFSLFQNIQTYPAARSLSGVLFEKMFHHVMRSCTIQDLCCEHSFLGLGDNGPTLQQRAARVVCFEAMKACPRKDYEPIIFASLEELKKRITDPSTGNFKEEYLGIYMRPNSPTFTSVDSMFFYRKEPGTSPIMLALLQHTLGASHPVKASGLKEIFDILPANIKTKGRSFFGVLAFMTTSVNYDGLTKQSYPGSSKEEVALWKARFVQIKIKADIDRMRDNWLNPHPPFRPVSPPSPPVPSSLAFPHIPVRPAAKWKNGKLLKPGKSTQKKRKATRELASESQAKVSPVLKKAKPSSK